MNALLGKINILEYNKVLPKITRLDIKMLRFLRKDIYSRGVSSCVSIAIIRICDSVCVSVCPHDETKLKSPNLAHG